MIHLWNTGNEFSETFPGEISHVINTGFYSLIHIAKAFDEEGSGTKTELMIITSGMCEVSGECLPRPDRSLVMGPFGVIPLEYPNISCRIIDIQTSGLKKWTRTRLEDLLAAEILSTDGRNVMVALRGTERWIRAFKPYTAEPAEFGGRLRPGGVYLITGGLGGVGLLLAEYISRSVNAKIVLLGRTELPPRDKWEEWVSLNGPDHKISQAILRLKGLEQSGSEISLWTADVADRTRMVEVVEQIQERLGSINGIIHAAGIADGGTIRQRTSQLSEEVFAAKVRGTLVLDSVVDVRELDFIVLCSSLASVIPAVGDVAYSAANAFLDAYANYKSQKDGVFTVSINWDGIKEVGMTVETAKRIAQNLEIQDYRILLKHDENTLEPQEVPQVFARLLGASALNVMVSTTALAPRIVRPSTPKTEVAIEASADVADYNAETSAWGKEVGRTIAGIFQEKLGVTSIRLEDDYFALGVDSLALVQIYSVIHNIYPGKLNVHHLFDCKTINGLVDIITGDEAGNKTAALEEAINIIEF